MPKKSPVGRDTQRDARNKKTAQTKASRAIRLATALLAVEAVRAEPSSAPVKSASGGVMHLLPLSSERLSDTTEVPPALQPAANDDSASQITTSHGDTAVFPAIDADGSGIRQRKVSRAEHRLQLSQSAAKQKIAELPSRFEGDADDSPNDSAALSLSAPAVPSVTQKRLRMRMVAPPLLDLEASSESVRVGLVYGMSFLTLTASFWCIPTG